jgi:hypothetical protein
VLGPGAPQCDRLGGSRKRVADEVQHCHSPAAIFAVDPGGADKPGALPAKMTCGPSDGHPLLEVCPGERRPRRHHCRTSIDLKDSQVSRAPNGQRGIRIRCGQEVTRAVTQCHSVSFCADEDAAGRLARARPRPREGLPRRETTTATPLSHVDRLERLASITSTEWPTWHQNSVRQMSEINWQNGILASCNAVTCANDGAVWLMLALALANY